MKYEHKTVGLSWMDALVDDRSPRNLGAAYAHQFDPDNDGWHVVGAIPPPGNVGGSDGKKTFFLLEREVHGDGHVDRVVR